MASTSQDKRANQKFMADGFSVGVVKYQDGVFRQVAPGKRWVEDAHSQIPQRSTYRFSESARTATGVLLYDTHRDVNVMIDLDIARVGFLVGAKEPVYSFTERKRFRLQYHITDATIPSDQSMFEITGLTIGVAKYTGGTFRRLGSGEVWGQFREGTEVPALFQEKARSIDTVILHDEASDATVVLDLIQRRILYRKDNVNLRAPDTIVQVAISEPFGAVMKELIVLKSGDFGKDEELYGQFYVQVVGKSVAKPNSGRRYLYDVKNPISIGENESREFVDHEVLFHGLEKNDRIHIAGWLKEKDIFGDEQLGSDNATVQVGDKKETNIVLKFESGKTRVEAHFEVLQNYNEHFSHQNGFLPVVTNNGTQKVPRFPGVVPMQHGRSNVIVDEVNILPVGPESVSNRLRTVIIFGLGYIPTVGSLLSQVVDMLWPDGQLEAWDEIRGRAEALMRNLITAERVRDVEKLLRGLKQTIDNYQHTPLGAPEKGSWLINVLASLNAAQPFFLDERNPEYMLPYLITVGTLTLVVMREQYVFYKEIYGRNDSNADYKLEEINRRYELYHTAVEKAVERSTEWRKALVTMKEEEDEFIVTDELTGYESKRFKQRPLILHRNLQLAAENEFVMRLGDMTQPAAAWKYMLPQTKAVKPTRTLATAISGPFPVADWVFFEENKEEERITNVLVSIRDGVAGIQFWYSGKPGPVHGKLEGEVKRLDLDDDESITAASGRSLDMIDALWLFTSKGRTIGGGQQGDRAFEWTAAPPSPDGYMEAIFGTIGGFGFKWRYYKTM